MQKKYQFTITLLLIILYQVLVIIQGLDLSDEGWAMYFYQHIFSNPSAVIPQMPYWVTGIVGGSIYKIWPEGGFFAMRLFGVILNTSIFVISYLFLKKHFNSKFVLIGLFIQVIIVSGDPKPFGYNSLTAFFAIIAMILLYYSLNKRIVIYSFFAGILVGINIFVRIPNFTQLAFILLIPIYFLVVDRKRNFIFNKYLLASVLGVIIAVLSTIKAMMLMGHWDYFLSSFASTVNSASDANNSHQFGRMLSCYLKNYGGILQLGFLIFVFGILYAFIFNFITLILPKFKLFYLLIFTYMVFICSHWLIITSNILRDNDMYAVHFISYFAAALLLISYKSNKEREEPILFFSLISIFMITFIPIGSDLGVQTMWTSTWLALPMAVAYLFTICKNKSINYSTRFTGVITLYSDKKKNFDFKVSIDNKILRNYFYVVIVSIIIAGLYQNYTKAYYDPEPGIYKVHKINNKYCNNIYTVSYRARILNELLPELNKYVKPNDLLLAYDFIPGINYMTETRSFTPNSWIFGYSGEEFDRQLKISLEKNKCLPVILRQHFIATNKWQAYDPKFYNENRKDDSYFKKKRTRALNDFINQYRYKQVWSNKNFEILLPEYN